MATLSKLKTLAIAALFTTAPMLFAAPSKIMVLTGQSSKYHDWTKSVPVIKGYLEQTGLFAVDVVTTPPVGADMTGFSPDFSAYAAIVVVYEGAEWPAATKDAFVTYMKNGGGLVTVHDTDNAFPFWKEWNEMIGVGGWGMKPDGGIGARDDTWGPKIRWHDNGMVLDTTTPGTSGHPPRHDFLVTTRTPAHAIMAGLPTAWLHASDEIYSQLRGPAHHVTVLATALADKTKHASATGENEPMLMTISYGKGRVFHTTLGHVGPNDQPPYQALACAGFAVTLQRGTEWAATGKVTQQLPADFPTAEKTSLRSH